MNIFEKIKFWYLRTFEAELLKIDTSIVEDPEDDRDYQLGASPVNKTILNPSGDWNEFLPTEEWQRNNQFDSMNCTVYSMLNVFECIFKAKWGKEKNFSERFSGTLCRTSRSGNSMNRVVDLTRNLYGVINETLLPFDRFIIETWNQYYAPVSSDLCDIGKNWLKRYVLYRENVPQTIQHMREALKYSPLYVSGYAWAKGRDGKYYSWGKANHAFMVTKIRDNGDFEVFDHYSPFKKVLDKSFKFGIVKLLTLNKKSIGFNKEEIKKLRDRGLEYILLVEPSEFYKAGVYKLLPERLEETPLKILLNNGVLKLAKDEKLVGINPRDFNKLLK